MNEPLQLLEKLAAEHSLTTSEYERLVAAQEPVLAAHAAVLADQLRRAVYGTDIYLRGLIEIGNICRNDCYYCGIRRSNAACDRYRLSDDQILACCAEGYQLGFRTFVLQGGEGVVSVSHICQLVSAIHTTYPDCAITLSLGEYPREDYWAMFQAGANRYLLRHETADQAHYERLHPSAMSFENRMRCLRDLKSIGFQVGCGFMVGSPFQTSETLAKDLKWIETFQPDMCGIGPFIPQKDTPFHNASPGTVDQTLYLLSLVRLIRPNILLPATTALGSIDPDGRAKGILAGANVVMPNLSPISVRSKYALYDNKLSSGDESAQCKRQLEAHMEAIGFHVVMSRGDIIHTVGASASGTSCAT